MAADHQNFSPFCESSKLSSNFGFSTQSPFGLPTRPSPFVGHLYSMVNATRAAPSFLSRDSSLAPSNPGSFLTSVAARRTDILYSEFYKNFLRSASKSQNLKLISGDPGRKTITSEIKTSDFVKESACKEPVSFNLNQIKTFYEGLYSRLSPNDYYLRLRAENPHGVQNPCDGRVTKNPHSWHRSSGHRDFLPFPLAAVAERNQFLNAPVATKFDSGVKMPSALIMDASPFERKYEVERSSDSPSPATTINTSSRMVLDPNQKLIPSPPTSSFDARADPASPTLLERMKRKRKFKNATDTCPVCGVTVRESEMKQHFDQEVSRLEKIAHEVYRNNKRSSAVRKSTGSTAASSKIAESSIQATTSSKKLEDRENQRDSSNKENRAKTFQKVRGNRLDRFNSKVGQCRQSMWRNGVPSNISPKSNGIWRSFDPDVEQKYEAARCPVCNKSLSGMTSHDQISDHVMQCVGPENNLLVGDATSRDAMVDVENGEFEEYEWCGETRVRVTALAHRDLLVNAPGFHVIKNAANDDSDQDLNVEADETCEYGGVQYTDGDLVPPCSSDEELKLSPDQNRDRSTPCSSVHSPHSSASLPATRAVCRSPSVVVHALRMKIQDLEESSKDNRCLICMEPYRHALVSIQCWHVHCERCWLRALGVKKLCPQCNMITPASHLRRIFL